MRLYTGVGSNVLLDGLTHPLEIPSGSRSGLKLNIQVTITGGVKYVLALDFDASHSIVVTGNGRYMLKPVIKTVATAISGGLTGVVAPASTRPTVRAIAALSLLASRRIRRPLDEKERACGRLRP